MSVDVSQKEDSVDIKLRIAVAAPPAPETSTILNGIYPLQVLNMTKSDVRTKFEEWDKRSDIMRSFNDGVLSDIPETNANAQLATWGQHFNCFVLTYLGRDRKEYCAIGNYSEALQYKVYSFANDMLTLEKTSHHRVDAGKRGSGFELNACFVDLHRCCLVRSDGTTT